MFIYELQFTLKPDAKPEELLRLFNDVAAPRFRKIPGLTSVTIVKYTPAGSKPPGWEYAYVEVWESKEAHDSHSRDQAETAELYAKFGAMVDKRSGAFATPVASTK